MSLNPNATYNFSITSGSIVRVILFGVLIAAIYFFWDILLVVVTAVVIASAIEPFTKALIRFKIPRTLAVVLLYLITLGGLAVVAFFFVPPILEDVAGILSTLPEQLSVAGILGSGDGAFDPSAFNLPASLSVGDLVTSIRGFVTSISSSFLGVLSTVFGGIMSFVLIIVLSFYLAVQEDGVAVFLRIITPVKHEAYMIDLWRRTQFKIARWLQGQFVLMLVVGVLVYLGLTILNGLDVVEVRSPLLLALLAAFFEIIPVFGPILAATPAIALAFIDGGATSALFVSGLYVVIQQFENQLIHPLVVRKVIGVPPLLVIIALIVGARVAGFLGIILSVPVAAAFREYMNDFQSWRVAPPKEESEGLAESV